MARSSKKPAAEVTDASAPTGADSALEVSPKIPRNPSSLDRTKFGRMLLERLLELLQESNVPISGRASILAGLTHRNRQTTTGWLKGTAQPDLYSFHNIVNALNGDPAYLLCLSTEPTKNLLKRYAEPATEVPHPCEEQGLMVWNLGPSPQLESFCRRLASNPEALLFVPNVGDAMEPNIHHNDTIGVDTSVTTIQGSGVYLLARGNQQYVRRIEEHLDGGYSIRCSNPAYESVKANGLDDPIWENLKVIGRVESVWKKMRMIDFVVQG